ncbi:hypothetical protein EJ110_NYTH43508 [Nymphaea thermarum]|nr:hypothetical protein EJ110_NYTH43508 [Nymphaea thermarum]
MNAASMEAVSRMVPSGHRRADGQRGKDCGRHFQMPLHYPRFTRADYETMPEWKLDCLLAEYGLPISGDAAYKRKFAIGAFIWPSSRA